MDKFNQYVNDLATLISFRSVQEPASENAPFGEQTAKALEFCLQLGKDFGFETINYDNYGGEIIFGDGEEFGIIGHLDVVPEGIGWNTPPYTLTKKDGIYYGRGIDDDKGPLLACLYALKTLKDKGVKPSKKFRLILGCNEETGWKDIEYIKTKTQLPKIGFSPDGAFSVSYAEKGVLKTMVNIPKLKNFSQIKGGTVINAVCAYVSVKASKDGINESLINKYGLNLKDGDVIESYGKTAHGSAPHKGKNAMLPLFNYMLEMGEDVGEVIDCLFLDKYGITKIENEQGKVTFSPDVISETDDGICIGCDCRVPAPATFKQVEDLLAQSSLNITYKESHPPVMIEKSSNVIQSLLQAYRNITGDMTEPFSMGGSTFARAFESGCAFGPTFPGENHCPHEPNECISEASLKAMFNVYELAIENLAK